jgi:hypothetical protein
MKDLTTSDLHRKNILNNGLALTELYKEVELPGILFQGKYRFTKKLVSAFFDVDERTIDRYLENYNAELIESGYEILQGEALRAFKLEKVDGINVVDLPEFGIDKFAPSLGTFAFKSFLNLGMLLTESENAKGLRSLILNIVIDTLNRRLGGSTKYINQREEEFVSSAVREFNYRQGFTNALDYYITPNKFKYSQLTDKIYTSIFREDSRLYRQVLNLKASDSVRSTMYSEVLDVISSYESGFAACLKKEFEAKKEKLGLSEAVMLFKKFETDTEAVYLPLIEKARSIMASRDMAFRDALHEKLKDYITHLKPEEFEKFLGEKSVTLEERLKENIDVFKRLMDR